MKVSKQHVKFSVEHIFTGTSGVSQVALGDANAQCPCRCDSVVEKNIQKTYIYWLCAFVAVLGAIWPCNPLERGGSLLHAAIGSQQAFTPTHHVVSDHWTPLHLRLCAS